MRVLVIGGGLFGCCAAIVLSEAGYQVDLIEEDDNIMKKASRVNHNRIHMGYHYLRSIETAEQSLEGLLSFMFNFGNSVVAQFPNFYAIAKDGSKTSTEQFVNFCDKVGIGYDEDYPDESYLNRSTIDSCFKVPEPIFDYNTVTSIVKKRLALTNLKLKSKCTSLKITSSGTYTAYYSNKSKDYDIVINATYAGYNEINGFLGVSLKRLLYEHVSIPEFRYGIAPIGLTVMDGPFCSIMPKGLTRNEFLLYNVKYSVNEKVVNNNCPDFTCAEHIDTVFEQSSLYMPFLKNVTRTGSNSIIRTIYENAYDARLTELTTYSDFPNYFAILSGKVTTCFKVATEIKHIIQTKS